MMELSGKDNQNVLLEARKNRKEEPEDSRYCTKIIFLVDSVIFDDKLLHHHRLAGVKFTLNF